MNETFSFKRFGTYFKYDIVSLWRKHSRSVILIGFSGVIAYVVCVLFSLLFNHSIQAPGIVGRFIVFVIAMLVLELYMTRFYGFLTEKKDGSNWILIPASKAEKYVSMLINTVIIIPLAFIITFLGTDWIICLLDKTAGNALICSVPDLLKAISWDSEGVVTFKEIGISPVSFIIMAVISAWANYMYFLLCGICFKKNKIFYAILIMFGLSTIFSTLSALIIPNMDFSALDTMDEEKIKAIVRGFVAGIYVFTVIYAVGMGWGVWHRISTIKH
ncbi:MAG: hypothetical protein J6W09_01095 [Bacteroidales bacterium]|nr:hypothetical protein [Bacteroidales bacterium]